MTNFFPSPFDRPGWGHRTDGLVKNGRSWASCGARARKYRAERKRRLRLERAARQRNRQS